MEAALPPPSKKPEASRRMVDAFVDRVRDVLPSPPDATLKVEAEAERQDIGHLPCIRRRFNLYEELFVFRRVVTKPWEAAWTKTPLALHDVELLHAFHFPPYLNAEPYDQVDNISKILSNHPGPVESLRVDCSRFPAPEILGRWTVGDSRSWRSYSWCVADVRPAT